MCGKPAADPRSTPLRFRGGERLSCQRLLQTLDCRSVCGARNEHWVLVCDFYGVQRPHGTLQPRWSIVEPQGKRRRKERGVGSRCTASGRAAASVHYPFTAKKPWPSAAKLNSVKIAGAAPAGKEQVQRLWGQRLVA